MSKRKIPSAKDVEAYLLTLPGKRGIDVPEEIYDRIHPVAHGMAMQVWGRTLEPQQIQDLYDHGYHQPDQVKQALGALQHPHAPSVTVNDYQKYSAAKQMFSDHQGEKHGGR